MSSECSVQMSSRLARALETSKRSNHDVFDEDREEGELSHYRTTYFGVNMVGGNMLFGFLNLTMSRHKEIR